MDTDIIIFLAVVISRLLLPLLIIRYPLPGVIICLVLDGIDQTIFQLFTDLPLEGYQSYDKALDIYYLAIAYISTFRNWTNKPAFEISRFLFYYRLIGVTLYEFVHAGLILLIFPNTFEYFFIFYEFVRIRWNPDRLTKKRLIFAAAFIWIFIKLPQEYWIHIAKLDTTDFLKEYLFHVPLDAGLQEIISQNQWLIPAVLIFAILVFFGIKFTLKKLPGADWKFNVDVNKHLDNGKLQISNKLAKISWRNTEIIEKLVMVSLISIIFTQMLPSVNASVAKVVAIVISLVLANTFISNWLTKHSKNWETLGKEFITMAIVNFVILFLFAGITGETEGIPNLISVLFFTFLITLMVTFYNSYRKIYNARFANL